MNHLNDFAKNCLSLSDEERIIKILEDRWIGYSQAQRIIARLEDLLKQPSLTRMPSNLIAGETNNGKTILVKKFYHDHKPYIDPEQNCCYHPVFYVQAPNRPDESKFYNSILDRLFKSYKFHDRVDKKQQQVMDLLIKVRVKMLIIDEIHHILAGTMTAQRSFLNMLKYLTNELSIVIVAVGTQDAFNAINTDPQLGNRFEPMVLPKWTDNNEYRSLLSSFERMLPLKKPSLLIEDKIALKILSMSEGTIGEITDILKKSAVMAVRNRTESISLKVLESIDYTSPSERKKQIDKMR